MPALLPKLPFALLTTLVLSACDSSPATPAPECNRGTLESDLRTLPLQGPGVDASGKLAPGQYVIASSYVLLYNDHAVQQQFQQVMVGIEGALKTQPGLVAYQLATSTSCNSGRALTVWNDEGAMFAFAAGSAHSAASGMAATLGQRGSAVTYWSDDESGATQAKGASELAAATPF